MVTLVMLTEWGYKHPILSAIFGLIADSFIIYRVVALYGQI